MSWAAVHLMSHREALALHCLRLASGSDQDQAQRGRGIR
jgi:hypothetical protein